MFAAPYDIILPENATQGSLVNTELFISYSEYVIERPH